MPHKDQPPTHFKIDLNAYAPYLENIDIPDTEKQELIETLWSLVTSFVQLGYGVSPTQQALQARKPTCGQNAKSQYSGAVSGIVLLEYSHTNLQKGDVT